MIRNGAKVTTVFIAVAVFLLGWTVSAVAEDITIVGEVNDVYQIVSTDGEIYEVADTEIGAELVDTMISQKVKVTGKLYVDGDTKTIEVISYQVVEE